MKPKFTDLAARSIEESKCGWVGLTGEDRAEFGPAGDPSLGGVLAQRDLQEEDRQASSKQEDEVRDEKRTWVTQGEAGREEEGGRERSGGPRVMLPSVFSG